MTKHIHTVIFQVLLVIMVGVSIPALGQSDTTARAEKKSTEVLKAYDEQMRLAEDWYKDGDFVPLLSGLQSFWRKDSLTKMVASNSDTNKDFRKAKDDRRNKKLVILKYMAFGYIATDNMEHAEERVNQILAINPNFEAQADDPVLFQYLVKRMKAGDGSIQIVSAAKRKESPYEAAATVIVVTQEHLQRRGYPDLEAFFSDLPGFDVARTTGSTYSNIYQRGYRSNNTDRTLFLIDSYEENDLYYGQAYISRQYPITNVKQIEIVYGPASTMYGANAFVGVVNIITKDPADICDGNFGASANIATGTYNTSYADITIAAKKNNVSFSATARRYHSDERDLSGYPEYDFDPAYYDTVDYGAIFDITENADSFVLANGITAAHPYWDIVTDTNGDTIAVTLTPEGEDAARAYDKAAFDTTLNGSPIGYSNVSEHWLFHGKLKVADVKNRFTAGFQIWKYEQGAANYINDLRRPGSDNGSLWSPQQSMLYTQYERVVSDAVRLTNLTQYRFSEVTDKSRLVDLQGYENGNLGAADLTSDVGSWWRTRYFYQVSRQFRNETKVDFSLWDGKFNCIAGIEVRNSSVYGDFRKTFEDTSSVIDIGVSTLDDQPGSNDFTIYDFGMYAQADYRLMPRIKLVLGARYDKNKVRTEGGYGDIVNPRVAVIATPGKFIVKGIYATAFKNASNFQKYSISDQRLLTNPTLQPEKVINYELIVGYHPNKDLYADVAFYYADYSGAVGTVTVAYENTTTTMNDAVGKLLIQGLQSTFNYRINDQYSLYANATYTHPQQNVLDDSSGYPTDEFERIGDIADYRFNAGVNAFYFDRLNVNLRMNYTSDRPVGEGTSVADNPSEFPAFFLLNGAIGYRDILPGLDLQLSCNNILDLEYFDTGIREASGASYTYRTPQKLRNFMFRLIYNFEKPK